MKVALVDEAYTTKSCPSCSNRYKPKGRNYACKPCGFSYHRDGVGSMNIRTKYLACGPVVGVMIPPVGIRYQRSPMLAPGSYAALAAVVYHYSRSLVLEFRQIE